MPDALIIRQATQVMLHLWVWIQTTWHLTVLQCSSGNCYFHVRCDSVSRVIKITDKLCVCNLRTEHLLCTRWHHFCLRALNTPHVVNPLVKIRLTKTNTQSLITIITHYMGRGQPPVLSTSITSPLAWSSQVMQLHCVAKYVEKSGTGVVFKIDIRWHYEYGNKLSKAAGGRQAGRRHMQM